MGSEIPEPASHRVALESAAERRGIELEYTDTWGRTHRASDETLLAVLAALGPEPEGGSNLPPTLVVYEDEPSLTLALPADQAAGTIKLELEWENGELEHHWFWMPELPGQRVPLPALRLGYHRLRIYVVSKPDLTLIQDARLIVCPHRAHTLDQRVAGVALTLYGLKSSRNWGIGDTTDLKSMVTTLAAAGAAFVALNPLHALPKSPAIQHQSVFAGVLAVSKLFVPRRRTRAGI
ncbi:MAG: 4-alpha-glucanotransferase [Acidobacteriota bacterium]